MNTIYKLVWHAASQAWIVASELAKGARKNSLAGGTALLLAGVAGQVLAVPAATTVPAGERVVSGSASFNRNVDNRLIVRQGTDKLITNWDSFDIGNRAQVIFVQPDAGSVALNRVTSASASQILGKLDANGQVLLVNPNGITFGAGSQVSAASIVASTMDITDANFLRDSLQFERGQSTAAIVNEGKLTATEGNVVLLAGNIDNQGKIISNKANILLGSASQASLVNNQLTVVNEGGSNAGAVIRSTGLLQATSIQKDQGRIVLSTGTSTTGAVNVRGTLDAGVTTLDSYATVFLQGDTTVNGNLNILSHNTNWDGGFGLAGKLTLTGDNAEFIVKQQHGNGIMHALNNQLTIQGKNSKVIVNDDVYHVVSNLQELSAIGRDKHSLSLKYLLGQDLDATVTGTWDNGAGFMPIGSLSNPFKGSFSGLGHTISNLSIQRSQQDNVGLFGMTSNAAIDHLNIKNISLVGANNVGAFIGFSRNSIIKDSNLEDGYVVGVNNVGGIVGRSGMTNPMNDYNGYFQNVYSDAEVRGYSRVGGVIGYSINNEFSHVKVQGKVIVETGSGGGIVGYSVNPKIFMVESYVDVAGKRAAFLGGVAGYIKLQDKQDFSYVFNAYAYGNIVRLQEIPISVLNGIGGVAGYFDGSMQSSDSYANITGNGYVGGVIGYNVGYVKFSDSHANIKSNSSSKSSGFYGGVFGYNSGRVDGGESNAIVKNVLRYGGFTGVNDGEIRGVRVIWNDVNEVESDFGGAVYINNNYFDGSLYGDIKADKNFGGVVYKNNGNFIGWLMGSIVADSDFGGVVNINNGSMSGRFNGSINAKEGFGGAVNINNGRVSDYSSVKGAIFAKDDFGGFVNVNYGDISYASVDAIIFAEDNFGGFANVNYGSIAGSGQGTIFHTGDFGAFVKMNSGNIGSSGFSGNIVNSAAQ